jgi:hypothetical protein
MMSEQEQITALANAYRSLVDELSVKGLIDVERVKHNAKELTMYPSPIQKLKVAEP